MAPTENTSEAATARWLARMGIRDRVASALIAIDKAMRSRSAELANALDALWRFVEVENSAAWDLWARDNDGFMAVLDAQDAGKETPGMTQPVARAIAEIHSAIHCHMYADQPPPGHISAERIAHALGMLGLQPARADFRPFSARDPFGAPRSRDAYAVND